MGEDALGGDTKLRRAPGPQTAVAVINFELDLDKLETIEGREELEDQMEPLGIRHLKVTKILADIQSDVILQKLLLQ